jgi:hypothetical protein
LAPNIKGSERSGPFRQLDDWPQYVEILGGDDGETHAN